MFTFLYNYIAKIREQQIYTSTGIWMEKLQVVISEIVTTLVLVVLVYINIIYPL